MCSWKPSLSYVGAGAKWIESGGAYTDQEVSLLFIRIVEISLAPENTVRFIAELEGFQIFLPETNSGYRVKLKTEQLRLQV